MTPPKGPRGTFGHGGPGNGNGNGGSYDPPPLPPEPEELVRRADAARAAAQGDPRLPRRSAPIERNGEAGPAIGRALVLAAGLVVLASLGAGFWLATVPLAPAVEASGVLADPPGRRSLVHDSGGRVVKLLVQEGEAVQQGAVLLEVDAVASERQRAELQRSLDAVLATEARLLAERERAHEIVFPPELLEHAHDPKAATRIYRILEDQKQVFVERRAAMAGEVELLRAQEARLKERVAVLTAALQRADVQQRWVDIDSAKGGSARERAERARLQRAGTEADGDRAALTTRLGEAEDGLHRIALRVLELRSQQRSRVLAELEAVQERRRGLEDALDGLAVDPAGATVSAPIAGRVVDLEPQAVGDAIPAGGHMLDIVPQGRPVVEATVAPELSGALSLNQPVRLRIRAFPGRRLPVLDGRVARIGEATEAGGGFPIRIDLDAASLARLEAALARGPSGGALRPGMPVDIAIAGPGRRLLDGWF